MHALKAILDMNIRLLELEDCYGLIAPAAGLTTTAACNAVTAADLGAITVHLAFYILISAVCTLYSLAKLTNGLGSTPVRQPLSWF